MRLMMSVFVDPERGKVDGDRLADRASGNERVEFHVVDRMAELEDLRLRALLRFGDARESSCR